MPLTKFSIKLGWAWPQCQRQCDSVCCHLFSAVVRYVLHLYSGDRSGFHVNHVDSDTNPTDDCALGCCGNHWLCHRCPLRHDCVWSSALHLLHNVGFALTVGHDDPCIQPIKHPHTLHITIAEIAVGQENCGLHHRYTSYMLDTGARTLTANSSYCKILV